MQEPRMGQRAMIWPTKARVQAGLNQFRQFLSYPGPPEGVPVLWDRHWHARLNDGDVSLSQPPMGEVK